MNVAFKFMIFFILIFAICGFWRLFNDFAFAPLHEAMDNQTAINPHPFPLVDSIFAMAWGWSFIAAIISFALGLAFEKQINRGDSY